MEKWRKKGDKCNQEFARTKSNNHHHRKPSTGGNSSWHQNIPYWEKKFVSSVGSIPWKKFLEAKEFTHLYDNIMKWDDYAGEEAFYTAKDRFCAQFHGLHCEAESHNPDLYNNKIDWNAQMDYNLLLDLDSEPVAPDDASQHEPVVIFEDVLPDPYKDYSPYGWGDSDDMKKDQKGINWDDYIDNGKIMWDNCDVAGGNDWWVWNKDDNNGDQGWNSNSYDDNNYCNNYSNVNNKRYISSHKTWRVHGNNYQRKNNGNYGNWKKSTGQSYESQHDHGSTFQGHGSRRIRVHQ